MLLHGFPQSALEWARITALLAPDARVIVPDLRGAGGTERHAEGMTGSAAGDLINLLDTLGLERASIVAHDWSALIAFALAIEHPERVERLVVLGVPPPYLRFHPRLMKAMPLFAFQYALAVPLRAGAAAARDAAPAALAHAPLRRAAGRDRAARCRRLPHVAARPARARAGSALYRRLIVPEFLRILAGRYRGHRLTVPTLALFGADDSLIPRKSLTGFEDDAPDLSIEYVPGAVHFLPDEQPDDIARRIRAFVRPDSRRTVRGPTWRSWSTSCPSPGWCRVP